MVHGVSTALANVHCIALLPSKRIRLSEANVQRLDWARVKCVRIKAAEMEEELGSGKARPNTVR